MQMQDKIKSEQMHWIRSNQIRSNEKKGNESMFDNEMNASSNEKEGNESMFDNEMNASSSIEWMQLIQSKSHHVKWMRRKWMWFNQIGDVEIKSCQMDEK